MKNTAASTSLDSSSEHFDMGLDAFIKRRMRRSMKTTSCRRVSVSEASLESVSETFLMDEDCSSTITPSTMRCSSRPSVAFQEEPEVLIIPTVHEYEQEELNELFYNNEDQEDMIEDARIVAGGGWVSEDDSGRGLEQFTDNEGSRERRRKVISAVLQEQQRLRESFESRSDKQKAIARVSSSLTGTCQDLAYERAYKDELESLPRKKEAKKKPGFLSRVSSMIISPSGQR